MRYRRKRRTYGRRKGRKKYGKRLKTYRPSRGGIRL